MKSQKQFLILSLLILACGSAVAQNSFQKKFGNQFRQGFNAILQTPDSGFIVAGYTNEFPVSRQNSLIVKYDSNFNIQWSKHYGGGGFNDIELTSDNGYILTGNAIAGTPYGQILLMKIDSAGIEQWNKTYGYTWHCVGNAVVQTNSGGYIIVGQIAYNSGYEREAIIIGTDQVGDTLWTKSFVDYGYWNANDIIRTLQDDYLVSMGENIGVLFKIDSLGNIIWSTTPGNYKTTKIVQFDQNIVFVAGTSMDLAKIDLNTGSIIWYAIFNYCSNGKSLTKTNDGNLVLAGHSNVFGNGGYDMFALKCDTASNVIWTKTFGTIDNEFCSDVIPAYNGDLIITGSVQDTVTGDENGFLVRKPDISPIYFQKIMWSTSGNKCNGNFIQPTFDKGLIGTGVSEYNGYSTIYLFKLDSIGRTEWDWNYMPASLHQFEAEGIQVLQTLDSGYVLVGTLDSLFQNGYAIYASKFDRDGNQVWERKFGTQFPHVSGNSIAVSSDSGFIIGGQIVAAPNTKAYLIKVNSNGDTLWTRKYDYARNISLNHIEQTGDGGYIATGGKVRGNGISYSVVNVIKTNQYGDTLWTRDLPYASGNWGTSYAEYGTCIQQTNDSGYILSALTGFNGASGKRNLIKLSPTGDVIWNKNYGFGEPFWVRQTFDGGYALTRDESLIKLNSNGDTAWVKVFKGQDLIATGCKDYLFTGNFGQTLDGGYAIIGTTGYLSPQVFVVRTDAHGNINSCNETRPPYAVHDQSYGGSSLISTTISSYSLYMASIASSGSGYSLPFVTDCQNCFYLPAAYFSYSVNNPSVQFTNRSSNATSWQWDFGDGHSSTDFNPVHTYTSNGSYSVCLTTISGCGSDSFCLDLTGITVANLSGKIRSENYSPVRTVDITCQGNPSQTTSTNALGEYNFSLNPGANYTLIPRKYNDATISNGISAIDVLLMRKHILGTPLLSPYKIIAADVNNSGNVTAADVLLVRSMILQSISAFSGNEMWSFVPHDFVFANPTNPFPYDTSRYYPSVTQLINQDFIGMKLGDVNNSWDPNILKNESFAGKVYLRMDCIQSAQAGDEISIPVGAKQFKNVSGMQFTLSWDKDALTFQSIENGELIADFATQKTNEGMMGVLWTDENAKGKTLKEDEILFSLKFIANRVGEECDVNISSSMIPVEAANGDLELMELGEWKDGSTMVDEVFSNGYRLYQNYPNPFSEGTSISFELPKKDGVIMEIYDLFGRKLLEFSGTYDAGSHVLQLNDKLNQGVYYLRFRTGSYSRSVRMLRL